MISPASFDYIVGRVLVASYSFTVAIAARLRHDRLGPNVLQDYFAARESNTVQSAISLANRS
jgi:hypothetical protein